jgi:hypothetical protein
VVRNGSNFEPLVGRLSPPFERGHVICSLRIAVACIIIAIISVDVALVFLLLVRFLSNENIGWYGETKKLRIERFWIHSSHVQ